MTRKDAIKFYLELRDSGKLEEFAVKDPKTMTPKERDLFYYDDDQVFFNKSVGELDFYNHPLFKKPKMDSALFNSLLGLESTRTFSDFTEEERRGLGIDD